MQRVEILIIRLNVCTLGNTCDFEVGLCEARLKGSEITITHNGPCQPAGKP